MDLKSSRRIFYKISGEIFGSKLGLVRESIFYIL